MKTNRKQFLFVLNQNRAASNLVLSALALALIASSTCAQARGGFRGGFGPGLTPGPNPPGPAGGLGEGPGPRRPGPGPFEPGAAATGAAAVNAGVSPASEAQRRVSANQTYNWGASNRLPMDAGLGLGPAGLPPGGPRGFTDPVSRLALTNRGNAVRRANPLPGAFTPGWWQRHARAWWYREWAYGWAWDYCYWYDLCHYWNDPNINCAEEPVEYAHGNTIRYAGNNVYYGTQAVGSVQEYYDQARSLATGSEAVDLKKEPASSWRSLGVFAITQGDQQDSNSIFQLAVNKAGIIRGNYYNPMTEETQPAVGKVDKKTKRAAWIVGANRDVVYDTGLGNLLSNNSTLLVHPNRNSTQQWNLVRLEKPKESTSSADSKQSK